MGEATREDNMNVSESIAKGAPGHRVCGECLTRIANNPTSRTELARKERPVYVVNFAGVEGALCREHLYDLADEAASAARCEEV